MAKVKIQMPNEGEIKRMFDMVPKLERYKVGDKAVRAGAKPVLAKAKQLAPRGNARDRDKWHGEKMRSRLGETPLKDTIKMVVKKVASGAYAVIGPEWPKGNKAYFNTSPKGRKQVLWGRVTGTKVATIRNWIVQAADETKSAQDAAMQASLKKSLDEMMKSLG